MSSDQHQPHHSNTNPLPNTIQQQQQQPSSQTQVQQQQQQHNNMRFHVQNRRVDAIRNIQKLEDVHLGMNPIDTANSDTVITWTLRVDGRLDFDSFIDRISDVILSNPNFIRFRSKYDLNTNGWIPLDGWTARRNAVCHKENDEDMSLAEFKSVIRVQAMVRGSAWVCHFQYQPGTDETIIRWILNHGLGDVYAIRSVLLSLLDNASSDQQLLLTSHPPPKAPLLSGTKLGRAYNDKKLSKYLRPLQKKTASSLLAPYYSIKRGVPKIDPIDFPALSLPKIERLAQEHQVTVQDVLLLLVAETKQRIGEQDDDWIWCPSFNPRDATTADHHHHHQLGDRMVNLSTPLPVYIGGNKGDLKTIHNSTAMIQGSSLMYNNKHPPSGTPTHVQIPPPPLHHDRIHCVTTLLGAVTGEDEANNTPTIFYQKIQSMRFHVHQANAFFFLSHSSSIIETTFTTESSQRADRGLLVHQTFLKIVKELHLLLSD